MEGVNHSMDGSSGGSSYLPFRQNVVN